MSLDDEDAIAREMTAARQVLFALLSVVDTGHDNGCPECCEYSPGVHREGCTLIAALVAVGPALASFAYREEVRRRLRAGELRA